MLTDDVLQRLLGDLESDRIERKASPSNMDRICEAICAFANDLPGNGQPGVVFIGVDYVDTESAAKDYLKQYNITYFNGVDLGSEISQKYGITGVPETYFVGKDGNLAGNSLGPITRDSAFMTEAQFVRKLEELLAK